MALFSKKSLSDLLAEASDSEKGLKKTLGSASLIALGIGAVIGAGLFSLTGMAAANFAGPGIMISFIIAAIGCAFAGLCYAEFASMIPVAGSAYTYSYATMGELVAWVIGWDLVLEYAVGAATVASSWAGYLNKLLLSFGKTLPPELIMTPFESVKTASGSLVHGIINLPAVFIVVVMSLVLMRGTSESAKVNNVIVVLKVSIVLIFIFVGYKFVNNANIFVNQKFPYVIPDNEGKFGKFGWTGVIRAAAVVFFAYVGFDAVSTAAQEAKDPKKNMPVGILGSLFICTILFIAFAYVMTGVAHYTLFAAGSGSDHLAPVATAIEHMGHTDASGHFVMAFPWLLKAITIAILLGYASVILVMLLGQSRVFFSMSHDGLLPSVFSKLHPKYHTPSKSNLFFMVFVSLFAAFVPGNVVGEMTSIGTLFAFILVCCGIIIMRKTLPDAPRAFKTPLVPLVPILGILSCLGMMVYLPVDTWIRLVIWMMIGFDIYLFRGIKNSLLAKNDSDAEKHKSKRVTATIGLVLCVILTGLAILHINTVPTEEMDAANIVKNLSLVIASIHIVVFGYYLIKKPQTV